MTGTDASCVVLSKPAQQGEAVQLRHHHVGQDQVRRLALGGGQRGGAVGDGLDRPARLEDPPHVVAHVRVVVREQDPLPRRPRVVSAGDWLGSSGTQRDASATYAGSARRRRRQRSLGADPFGGQVSAAARDRDRERRPAAQARAHGHRAPVHPHQLVHQRQSDPRAFMRARARAAHAMEALEQVRQLLRGNARAGVGHRQLDVLAAHAQRHRDGAFERELERVRQQVEDDLLPHVAIDEDGLAQRRTVDPQLEARAFDRRAEAARQIAGHRREIRRLIRRLGAVGLDAREVEQVVHQLQQPQLVPVDGLQRLARQRAARFARVLRSAPASASAASGTRG